MFQLSNFRVSEVQVEPVEYTESSEEDPTIKDEATVSSICSQLLPYKMNHCTEVLWETHFVSKVKASPINGFVKTVIECYNSHQHLVLRPDDIWTAVMTQFSYYINKNAEQFRKQFVDFEGKKQLVVVLEGTIRSASYDVVVEKMTEKIHENLVDDNVKDWILPNFTTTTENDIVCCGVILMAIMKEYFEYTLCLKCGTRSTTLVAKEGDWENIRNRLEKLKDYKLDKWCNMLQPILDQFNNAKKGTVDDDFWNNICYCSECRCGPQFISGWISAFAIYDEKGTSIDCDSATWPVVRSSRIPFGSVNVDLKIRDDDGDHESIMLVGHIAKEVLGDGLMVNAKIGCGIALKMNSEEVDVDHKAARAAIPFHYCVPNCKSNYDTNASHSRFKFPTDEIMKEKWLKNIYHKDKYNIKSVAVCSLHFEPHFIKTSNTFGGNIIPLERPRLLPEAIPTSFEGLSSYLYIRTPTQRKDPEDRAKEIESREHTRIQAIAIQEFVKEFRSNEISIKDFCLSTFSSYFK